MFAPRAAKLTAQSVLRISTALSFGNFATIRYLWAAPKGQEHTEEGGLKQVRNRRHSALDATASRAPKPLVEKIRIRQRKFFMVNGAAFFDQNYITIVN